MRHTLTCLGLVLALGVSGPALAGPVEDSQKRKARELYKKGEDLLKDEKFEQAAAQFKKAIELDKDLVLAHYGLGQSYMALKQFPDAVQAFVGSREAYFRLVAIRMSDRMAAEDVSMRMVDDARSLTGVDGRGASSKGVTSRLNVLRDLEQAKRLDNGNPEPPAEISLALAGAWFRQGNLEEAEKENKNALQSKPDYGQAHSNLAVIYMMTGRLPESRTEVEKAEKSGFAVNPKLKEELDRRAAQ
ncbi:MAG: tetratricopeptide repeat protein [Solirubrobacterales bacterium]